MNIKERSIKVTGILLFYLFTFLPLSAQYDVVPLPQSIELQKGELKELYQYWKELGLFYLPYLL